MVRNKLFVELKDMAERLSKHYDNFTEDQRWNLIFDAGYYTAKSELDTEPDQYDLDTLEVYKRLLKKINK